MGLPFSEETIANVLGKVGYHSGVIGKWHIGATQKHHPLNRGFREFYGHLGGGHQYFPKELTIKDSDTAENESQSYRTWILRNHEPVAPRKYLTTEFSDEAVSFIERNSAKPFFLFLSYNAPHAPLQAPGEYLKRFPHIEKKQRKIYAAMVSAIDDGVGRVLKTLREKEIEKDTLVVFLSDNGGPTTKNGSNNAPLRGGKGDAWEGGWRVPFAMQWPGGLPKGKTYSHPVISLDIMTTIVALTKAPVAKERPLDGVNLIPFVSGKKKGPPHQGIFLRKFDSEATAVRSGEHKLVTYENKGYTGLFDLTEDISESKNIRDQSPEDVARLKSLWKDWNKSNIDPVFKGLIHTPAWQKKRDQAARKKAEAENK
jgi:arylsulfatase A-like enzyme